MTRKLLTTGVAVAALAGLAAGITEAAQSPRPGAPVVSAAVAPAVFGTPLPLDPAAPIPTADQLTGVLYGLANPAVPFASKGNLVEGGIGRLEARTADALMRNAVAKGQTPLSFTVSGITPAGPGAATADVTASGPAMPPATQNILFVDQGGWKLSRSSATTVLSMFSN